MMKDIMAAKVSFAHTDSPSIGSGSSGVTDPLVRSALELFENQPKTRWTVRQVAKVLGTSRPVLNRRFNEALKQPPLRALREIRMRHAAFLLTTSEQGLAAIADSVGYDSEFALSRAFFRHFAVRPGKWRSEYQRCASVSSRRSAA